MLKRTLAGLYGPLALGFWLVSFPAAAAAQEAAGEWRMPPTGARSMPMIPSLMGKTPPEVAWLPGAGIDAAAITEA